MQLNPQHSTRSRFKLVESDPLQINKNSLNSSSSKMQYSIPKSKRWDDQKAITQKSKFYDLPQLKSNRSTSFGYGDKTDLAKQNLATPSPMKYNILGAFDNKNKKDGISFGAGRDIVKNVNTFDEKPFKVPGPQDYNAINPTIENGPKYSIGGRNKDFSQKWIKSVPGPGTYSTIELIRNNDKVSNSKYENSPSVSFTKNKRLNDYQERIRLLKVPGPGQYKIQEKNSMVEKFSQHGGKRFGKSLRKGIVQKSTTPGPGSYKSFSQFIF